MSLLRRLFDRKYHHLSKGKAEEYLLLIGNRYDSYIKSYGDSLFKKADFLKRYCKALDTNADLHAFFVNEIEYLDLIIAKIKGVEEERKAKKKEKSQKKKEDLISVISHGNDGSGDRNTSVFERIYDDYASQLRLYPQINIHKDASEEIERLLGCLADFGKKLGVALIGIAVRVEKTNKLKGELEELKFTLDDICIFHGNQFPLVFQQYLFKVESSKGDDALIELADINVLKQIVSVIKKIKITLNALDDSFVERQVGSQVPYGDVRISIEEFKDEVRAECHKILTDFRMDEF